MSRKMLIVSAISCLLVATLVVPAMVAPSETDGVTPVLTGVRTGPDGQAIARLVPIQPVPTIWSVPPMRPDGDCEGAGAGGCPIPG